MFLTAESGFLSPLSTIFGFLMNYIYNIISSFGVGNIGLAIIIFTLITRIILFPLTINQQKSSRMMSIIQPEINDIQKKYEGQKDQATLLKQQQEIKEVYEKYGTSMTGGCLQSLIQIIIIIPLYRIITNIPAYVTDIKEHFNSIVDSLGGISIIENLKTFAENNKLENVLKSVNNFEAGTVEAQKNLIIDFLYKLNPNQMTMLINEYSEEIRVAIEENINFINKANSFLGLNLATSPNSMGFTSPYIIIPIAAFLSQYLSFVIMQKASYNKKMSENTENQVQQTMKMMNITMPIFSAWLTYQFSTGIGLYWICSSLFLIIQQLFVNYQMSKINIDEEIKNNIEKANKKRAKKGLPPINEKKAINNIKKKEEDFKKEEDLRNKILEGKEDREKEAEKFYFDEQNKDSIFSKVNMVSKYNEKNEKK